MAASGNPLPEECNVCRIARDLATGKCVPDCKEPNFLSPNKLCVDKSGNYHFTLCPSTQALTHVCMSVRVQFGDVVAQSKIQA